MPLIFSRNTPTHETLTPASPCFEGSGFEGEDFMLTVRRLTPIDRARITVASQEARKNFPDDPEGNAMYNTAFNALVFQMQVEGWDGFNEEDQNEEGEIITVPMVCTPEAREFVAQASPRLAAAVTMWVYGGEGEGVKKGSELPLGKKKGS